MFRSPLADELTCFILAITIQGKYTMETGTKLGKKWDCSKNIDGSTFIFSIYFIAVLWSRNYEITKERSQNVNSVNGGVFHQSKQNTDRKYRAKANKRAINSIKLSERREGAKLVPP